MVKPLDLPELRAHVGEFLNEEDLTTCLCVCRDWYDTYMPFRWRDIRIIGIHSIRADVNLRKHAHLVRSLAFLRIISLLHFSHVDRYNQLERIHITKTDVDGRRVWEKFSALVRHSYRTLRVMILEDMAPRREFLAELGKCDHDGEQGHRGGEQGLSLKSLMWKRVTVYVDCHALFWRACKGAYSLVLECMTIKGLDQAVTSFYPQANVSGSTQWPPSKSGLFLESESITSLNVSLPTPPPPPTLARATLHSSENCRIQHIRVSWTIALTLELQLYLWIQPCSQLQSLVWEAFAFQDSTMLHFSNLLRSNSWPFLTSLDLTSCMTTYPTDASLAMVLDASPNPLERLCLKSVDFGPLAFKSLMAPGRHFEKLKVLMWVSCGSKVTSEMAKVVMENCKRLEIFHAPYLLVKDIEIPDTSNEQGGGNNEMGFKHEDQSKLEDEQDIASSLGQHPGPWSCLDLHTLYIGATAPSYASPPLTKREEDVIRTRLKSLCKLRNYQVGATISSASPPWLDK